MITFGSGSTVDNLAPKIIGLYGCVKGIQRLKFIMVQKKKLDLYEL